MKKIITIIIAVTIIVGSGAFYGGIKYAQSTRQNLIPRNNLNGQEFNGNINDIRLRQRFNNQGLAIGEIISKDDKSITLKLRNGGSKIIFLADSTEITKSTKGTLDDLENGKNVVVNGTTNSDGSITAQIIQLRPNLQ